MKRVIFAVLGVGCIFAVVWLGFKTLEGNPVFTVLFGIACAFIAPSGIMALGLSLRKKDEVLEKLSKVPEIDKLVQEVATQEDRLKKIEKMKIELRDYIRNEAYLLAASERKKLLVEDAKRVLAEIDAIDAKSKIIFNQTSEDDEEIIAIKAKVREIVTQTKSQAVLSASIGVTDLEAYFVSFNPFIQLISLGFKFIIEKIRIKRKGKSSK